MYEAGWGRLGAQRSLKDGGIGWGWGQKTEEKHKRRIKTRMRRRHNEMKNDKIITLVFFAFFMALVELQEPLKLPFYASSRSRSLTQMR